MALDLPLLLSCLFDGFLDKLAELIWVDILRTRIFHCFDQLLVDGTQHLTRLILLIEKQALQ